MSHGQPILIVDGDSAMRETLREQLTRDGAYAVVEAASASEAERILHDDGARFSAIIMDAVLPDGDGHAVCTRLRASGRSLPVILLNGSNRIGGSDNTITLAKPFRLSELMNHLRARLDQPRDAAAPARFRIGRFEFCHEEKLLRHDDSNTRIRLTEKEASILAFLHALGARAASREELLREVWGYKPAVTTHTLETHVYRLRRKIEADPAKARFLVTEAGGYRLMAG